MYKYMYIYIYIYIVCVVLALILGDSSESLVCTLREGFFDRSTLRECLTGVSQCVTLRECLRGVSESFRHSLRVHSQRVSERTL